MESNKREEQSRLHQPQTTTPVNQRSGDKLSENPSNDEETISQKPKEHYGDDNKQTEQSRDHDKGSNRVTNEDEEKEVVNPEGGDWDTPETETTPTKNPYEGVDDNPDDTQRKIPRL